MKKNRFLLLLVFGTFVLLRGAAPAQSPIDLSFSRQDVSIEEKDGFQVVTMKGSLDYAEREGYPQLPVFSVTVALPAGMEAIGVSVAVSSKEQIQGAFRLYPFQGLRSTEQARPWVSPNADAYARSTPYPPGIATLTSTGSSSGMNFATILVSPVSCVPSRGELTLYTHLSLSVDYRPASGISNPARRLERSKELFELLGERVINKNCVTLSSRQAQISELRASQFRIATEPVRSVRQFAPRNTPSLEGSGVDYLIITNDAMASTFEGLALWKTQKGTPTVVKSVSWIKANCVNGLDDAETIRNFIREAYLKWGVTFVLLGGDVGIIPARRVYVPSWVEAFEYVNSDLYYACLDGNWNANGNNRWCEIEDSPDLYPDVFVGRAPVTTPSEASLFVQRTLQYERGGGDDNYRNSMLFLGENMFEVGDGEFYCETVDSVAPPMTDTKIYQNQIGSGWTRETVMGALNDGPNLIFSETHANQYAVRHLLYKNDLDMLTNGTKYGIWYAVGCHTNNFELDCFARHFLLNPDGGGVAYVGATGNDYPCLTIEIAYPFFHALDASRYNSLGEAFNEARLAMLAYVPSGAPYRATYVDYTLLGDPELPVSLAKNDGYSRQVLASHVGSVELGTDNITVEDVKEIAHHAVRYLSGALVTLFKDGEVFASDTTNQSGAITFTGVRPRTGGSISVVVTAPNHLPYVGTINVESTKNPHPYYVSADIDDDNLGSSRGNGDGVINPGETIEMRTYFANSGGQEATDVKATAGSTSPYIQMGQAISTFESIKPGGEPQGSSDIMVFSITSDCPDNQQITISLAISGGCPDGTDEFSISVKAPLLVHTTTGLYDLSGNPVQWRSARDGDYDVKMHILNVGSGAIPGISATFLDSTGRLQIHHPTVSLGDFAAFEEKTAVFRCMYTTGQLGLGASRLRVFNDLGTYVDRPFQTGDVSIPGTIQHDPRKHSTVLSWQTVASASSYNVYRDGQKVNKVPVTNGLQYEDDGLDPNTPYQYTVRAMDGMSNESIHSSAHMAWTEIGSKTGWPKATSMSLVAAPAVDDLDGNGDLEVIAGNREGKIYCWHHDGHAFGSDPTGLMIDVGPQNEIWAQPVVSDLDRNDTKELIVTTRGTWQNSIGHLYVWSVFADGETRLWAGFPLSFARILARPAIGDLNGDGSPDIAVLTEDANGQTGGGLFVVDLQGRFLPGFGGAEFPDKPLASYASPFIADINDDGANEIVVGARDLLGTYRVYAFRGNGEAAKGWPIDVPAGMQVHFDPVFVGFEEWKIAVVTHNFSQVTGNNGKLLVLKGDGSAATGWANGKDVPLCNFLLGAPTVTHIIDEHPEIFLATSNGPVGWFWDGSEISQWSLSGSHPAPPFPLSISIATGHLGDGGEMALVVCAGKKLFAYLFDDASTVVGWPVEPADGCTFAPVIADMDRDGVPDLILSGNDGLVYAWSGTNARGVAAGAHPSKNGGNEELPRSFALQQNYPNPFNPTTRIHYELPQDVAVEVKVFNILGQEVAVLANGVQPAGRYDLNWRPDGKGSGVYFVRMVAGNYSAVRKIMLLR